MQNRQINTTENEVSMVIGIAANEIAEKEHNMVVQAVVIQIAAKIADIVIGHLAGDRRLPEEQIRLWKEVIKMESGSAEEDK